MILCKYDDFMSKTTTHTLNSFSFCNDADVIGVNLVYHICALFSFLDYIAMSNTYESSLFWVPKCFSLPPHADTYLYSLLFRVLSPLCSFVCPICLLFRSMADILVSMQILSKFAVNYVLCIFTSAKKLGIFVGGFLFFCFLDAGYI